MEEKREVGSGLLGMKHSGGPVNQDSGVQRRRYSPPRLLGAEPLELAAGGCDIAGAFGKTVPSCGTLGT